MKQESQSDSLIIRNNIEVDPMVSDFCIQDFFYKYTCQPPFNRLQMKQLFRMKITWLKKFVKVLYHESIFFFSPSYSLK